MEFVELRHETLEALEEVFNNLSMLSKIAEPSIHLFFHPNNRNAANMFLDIMELDYKGIKAIFGTFKVPSEEEFKGMDCSVVGMTNVCHLILIYLRRFLRDCCQAKPILNHMQEFNNPNWDDGMCDNLIRDKRLFANVVDNLLNLCTLAFFGPKILEVVTKVLDADSTVYQKLPAVSLTMIHLILSSSSDAKTLEAALKVLMGFEIIKVINEAESPTLKLARKFIKSLITSDEILQKFLYVYKLFDVTKDQASKEFLNTTMSEQEKIQLRDELLALLDENIYKIPNTRVWAGYTFCDGSFSIAASFVTPGHHDKIQVAQTVLIILHELSHKKRLKHQGEKKYFKESTPEEYKGVQAFKEAGLCLEQEIFGTMIGNKLWGITLEMAKKLLDKNCWKNGSIIEDVFKKLAYVPRKSGPSSTFGISPFDDCRCGKGDFNKTLEILEERDECFRSEGINID